MCRSPSSIAGFYLFLCALSKVQKAHLEAVKSGIARSRMYMNGTKNLLSGHP